MTNDDQTSALGLGFGALLVIGHCSWHKSASSMSRPAMRGARGGKRSRRIRWKGKELHDRRTVHGAKLSRHALFVREKGEDWGKGREEKGTEGRAFSFT